MDRGPCDPYAEPGGVVSGGDSELRAGAAQAAPQVPAPARIDAELVVDVLAALAGADSAADVAAAGLPLLVDVAGVRAAAVAVRDGGRVVVLGSAGYGCGSMAPGAVLPLEAGLPLTEAVRTGRPVVQGSGPAWAAVPFARGDSRGGALLLSLDGAPPASPGELARLHRIARALGDALHRATAQSQAFADLALVTASLAVAPPPAGGWDVAVRSLPHDGPVGGDTALCLSDERGGHWLLAADVCGSGLAAAVVGRTVQATFTALAPYLDGPSGLLDAVDRALRPVVGPGCFVTAVAVRAVDGRLDVASAGHPAPLLLTPAGAAAVDVPPGPPLALETGATPSCPQVSVPLPRDGVVLLHTDGLTDRRGPAGAVAADVIALAVGQPLDDLDALADGVLRAADEIGPAGDDASLLVARPSR